MSKTNFILVRHGESLGNAARIVLGHTDMDLSELGYRQAKCTADYLKDVKIDEIYSSDLQRARNTAFEHAKIRGMEVKTSEKLREIFCGDWEKQSVPEVREKYPDVYDIQWIGGFGTFTFPGGESTQHAGARFYKEIRRIAEENCGKTVLVAAHAAVIRAFWAIMAKIEPEKVAEELPFPTNASYSLFSYENGEFVLDSYSCDEHLAEVGITGKIGISEEKPQ